MFSFWQLGWWWGQDTSAVTHVLEKQFPQLHIPCALLDLRMSRCDTAGRVGAKGKSLAQSPVDSRNTSGSWLI